MEGEHEIETAAEALALIQGKIISGLIPVMSGTRFYRHSFVASPLGNYIWYLDARGTRGAFLPKNVERVLDFVPMPEVLAAYMADVPETTAAEEPGFGIATAIFEPEARRPTLVEAASAALKLLDDLGIGGKVRDDLAQAIKTEGRVH